MNTTQEVPVLLLNLFSLILNKLEFPLIIESANDEDALYALSIASSAVSSINNVTHIDVRTLLGLLTPPSNISNYQNNDNKINTIHPSDNQQDHHQSSSPRDLLLITGIDSAIFANESQPNSDNSLRVRLEQTLIRLSGERSHRDVIASARSLASLLPDIQAVFVQSYTLPTLSDSTVDASLQYLLQRYYPDHQLRSMTSIPAYSSLREACIGISLRRAEKLIAAVTNRCFARLHQNLVFDRHTTESTELECILLSVLPDDVTHSLQCDLSDMRREKTAPNICSTHWADIGGLDRVREEILFILQYPLQFPEVFRRGTRGRGILLYGPPGTGKTLVAKAVATECGLLFISVKGPELLDMYVGESERNVRRVFADARDKQPSILFFDELDSLAPSRGKSADAGAVMDRIVSQLLIEMDIIAAPTDEPSQGVFVIGATNRPDLLDPALLRAGRFDKKMFLGTCKTVEARLSILRAQTRKLNLGADVNLLDIASSMPESVTGADIGAVTSAAFAVALEKKLEMLEASCLEALPENERKFEAYSALAQYVSSVSESDLEVKVALDDFKEAIRSFTPSVSAADLSHYEILREMYEG